MSEPPRTPDAPRHTTPGWVKAFWIVGAILAVLVILLLTGVLGDHGPGRHSPPGGGHRPPVQHGP